MSSQEDRLPQVPEPGDHVPRRLPRRRIEAGGRLIEEHQLRVTDQGQGHIQPPALAARQPAAPDGQAVRQAH